MEVRVKNAGTRKLNNIRVSTDLPLNWRSTVDPRPDRLARAGQGRGRHRSRFQPPADVAVGDYEPKIKTECSADNRKVESEDKIVRVHVASKTNVIGHRPAGAASRRPAGRDRRLRHQADPPLTDEEIFHDATIPILKADDLSKRYEDGVLALDHLNLTVRAGEVYCLLGANGAGKTTTINLFLGFIPPTTGACFINGIDVAKDPLEAKKHVAFVSENVMLYGNFTARQNLDFFAKLGGKPDLDKERYYQVMRRVSLQEKAFEQRVKTFSKGMRQKLGISIAIIKDAAAILLDEPTSGLDPKAAEEFQEILRELKAEGKAILMSTHDIFRAKEIGDRVGIMKEGRLVMERTREELQVEDLVKIYIDYMKSEPLTA